MATIEGTAGNDSLLGTTAADRINTRDGRDTVDAGAGDDEVNGSVSPTGTRTFFRVTGSKIINGRTGRDTLFGGDSADRLFGDEDDDRLFGLDGADWLDGGMGQDELDGGEGDDSLWGGEGRDTLDGGNGNDVLSGDDGDDLLYHQGAGAATLLGGAGNDALNAVTGTGNKWLDGGSGDDRLDDGNGNDLLIGGDGADTLVATQGRDTLRGGDGDDKIYDQSASTDTLLGEGGNDLLSAFTGSGTKTLDGGDGQDTLQGGTNADLLLGGAGADYLAGHEGSDTLNGGAGGDTLVGGAGADVFVLNDRLDLIIDGDSQDVVRLEADWIKVPARLTQRVYADGVQALPYWIDALTESDANWFTSLVAGDQTLRYAFPSTLPGYITSADDARGFTPFTAEQVARTQQALDYLSSLVNLRFVQTTEVAAPNTLAFASNQQTGSAGYARFPNASPAGSDIFLNLGEENRTLADGTYGALTLIHEIAHALGLKHPFDEGSSGDSQGPYLTGVEDSTVWTVMSYNEDPVHYRVELRALDIAALHYLYGPNPAARAGNDRHVLSATEPNFIWDGAGIDTLDASGLGVGATLHLAPGWWSHIGASRSGRITDAGQVTVNFGTILENLIGSSFADALHGNEVANAIQGGAGNDTITGGAGSDTLDGGSGVDTVVYAGRAAQHVLGHDATSGALTLRLPSAGTEAEVDTLIGLERLQFADRSIPIESRAHGGFSDLPASVYQFFILAFGAAPGVEYLQQCADAFRGGADVRRITNVFCTKGEFTEVYPNSLSNRELAVKLVTNVVGGSASQAARDEAVADITAALDNGLGRGDMIFTVFSNLATLRGNAQWGGTAQLFFNQIAVAQYYTETLNQSTTDRATLTAAISAVTATSDVSSPAALITLVGQGLLGG